MQITDINSVLPSVLEPTRRLRPSLDAKEAEKAENIRKVAQETLLREGLFHMCMKLFPPKNFASRS